MRRKLKIPSLTNTFFDFSCDNRDANAVFTTFPVCHIEIKTLGEKISVGTCRSDAHGAHHVCVTRKWQARVRRGYRWSESSDTNKNHIHG